MGEGDVIVFSDVCFLIFGENGVRMCMVVCSFFSFCLVRLFILVPFPSFFFVEFGWTK